jgi:hypothetical protein
VVIFFVLKKIKAACRKGTGVPESQNLTVVDLAAEE